MKLSEIQRILGAEALCCAEALPRVEAQCACGADLMSDVLAFTKERAVLLTGLTHPQVIRTAEVADLTAIVFVRGKRPSDEVVGMAKERSLPLLLTRLPLYESCGLLFRAGLKGCSE